MLVSNLIKSKIETPELSLRIKSNRENKAINTPITLKYQGKNIIFGLCINDCELVITNVRRIFHYSKLISNYFALI
jgi:hypothetical protein